MLQPEAWMMDEILDVPNMGGVLMVGVHGQELYIRNKQRLASEVFKDGLLHCPWLRQMNASLANRGPRRSPTVAERLLTLATPHQPLSTVHHLPARKHPGRRERTNACTVHRLKVQTPPPSALAIPSIGETARIAQHHQSLWNPSSKSITRRLKR